MLVKCYRLFLIVSLIIAVCGACSVQQKQGQEHSEDGSRQVELLVSAAASLSVVLDEIIASFQQRYNGVSVKVNYGSSGTLLKQIEQGAPVDVFISAGSKQMNTLLEQELVEEVTPLLRNSLVVVSASPIDQHYHSLAELMAAVDAKYIALGQPETVPAGHYAQQALTADQIWSTWEDRYVYGKDVRQVLTYVEQGNATIGFVYYTDALSSTHVQAIYTVDETLHEPIEYPIAIIAATKHTDAARQFYSYVQQAEWRELYEQSGFQVVP